MSGTMVGHIRTRQASSEELPPINETVAENLIAEAGKTEDVIAQLDVTAREHLWTCIGDRSGRA